MKRKLTIFATAAAALGAFAPSASAGVADYPFTDGFSVPNGTDNAGLPAQVFVPPGRTAATGVELVGIKPSYPAGGGLDFQLFLQRPGQAVATSLMSSNCSMIANTTSFSLTDTATQLASTANCAQLLAGTLKPDNPLSAFAGPSGGIWTLGVRDIGLNGANNGNFNGYTLRLTHAAPTISGSAAKQAVAGTQYLTVTPNANGNVTVGGDGTGSAPVAVVANRPATIPFTLSSAVKKKAKKKGKGTAKVTVNLADETNGTATATVSVPLTAKKKKKK